MAIMKKGWIVLLAAACIIISIIDVVLPQFNILSASEAVLEGAQSFFVLIMTFLALTLGGKK